MLKAGGESGGRQKADGGSGGGQKAGGGGGRKVDAGSGVMRNRRKSSSAILRRNGRAQRSKAAYPNSVKIAPMPCLRACACVAIVRGRTYDFGQPQLMRETEDNVRYRNWPPIERRSRFTYVTIYFFAPGLCRALVHEKMPPWCWPTQSHDLRHLYALTEHAFDADQWSDYEKTNQTYLPANT